MRELDIELLAEQVLLGRDRARGRRLLAEMQARRRSWADLDPEERRLASGIALVDLVLERSRLARFESPERMVELAEAGRLLADNLASSTALGDRVWSDVRARAWAELGNAYRVADDLRRADLALSRALELASGGTGASLLAFRLGELWASLLTDQRHLEDAAEILEKLESVHRRRLDSEALARVLLKLGHVRAQANEPELAIRVYAQALELLEPGSPHLLSTVHGLAANLVEAGLPVAARTVLARHRGPYRRAGRLTKVRLLWLEGKIAHGLRQFGQAEAKFNTARLAFQRVGKVGDAALVSLDHALMLAGQERRKELSYLIGQMLTTFRSLGIAREVIASVVLVKTSAERQVSMERLCGQIETLAGMIRERQASKTPL